MTLDCKKDLFNFNAQVYNLKTAELRYSIPSDLLSKSTDYSFTVYSPEARQVLMIFFQEIFYTDQEVDYFLTFVRVF